MMSKTVLKEKKKKTDFELLRKLENEYDEAVEDLENKEEILIKKVHSEYLKADNKGEFWKQLTHSDYWYRERFEKYDLPMQFADKSSAMKQVHAERKITQFIDELDEIAENEPQSIEISNELSEDTDYVEPAPSSWIEDAKKEIQSEPAIKIVKDIDFGKYQETYNKIKKINQITLHSFNVGVKYRLKLVAELKKQIEYLNDLLNKIQVNDYEKP